MTRAIALLILLVAAAPPAAAQPVALDRLAPAFDSASLQKAARLVSDVSAGVNVGLDLWQAWQARGEDQGHELLAAGLSYGAVFIGSELVKRLAHRERPDGSDRLSFWSEHTAFSSVAAGRLLRNREGHGKRLAVAIALSSTTGAGRVKGKRHWLTDVLAGAGSGLAAGALVP